MQIYKTVVGNTSPSIDITCQRDSTAINLTAATSVILIIKNERTGTVTNTVQTCTPQVPLTDGVVRYAPLAADFPTADRYLGDIKITNNDGTIEYLEEQLLVVARLP